MTQTARTVVMSGLVLTMVMTGIFILIAQAVPSGSGGLENYNTTITKLNTIKNESKDIQSSIEAPPEKKTGIQILDSLIQGTIGAAQQMWNTVSALTSFFGELGEGALGPIKIPSWVTYLITSIIGLTLAYALMSAWFKWKI